MAEDLYDYSTEEEQETGEEQEIVHPTNPLLFEDINNDMEIGGFDPMYDYEEEEESDADADSSELFQKLQPPSRPPSQQEQSQHQIQQQVQSDEESLDFNGDTQMEDLISSSDEGTTEQPPPKPIRVPCRRSNFLSHHKKDRNVTESRRRVSNALSLTEIEDSNALSFKRSIPHRTFVKVLKEVVHESFGNKNLRFSKGSVGFLHEVSELVMMNFFGNTAAAAEHRNVITIAPKDAHLVLNITQPNNTKLHSKLNKD